MTTTIYFPTINAEAVVAGTPHARTASVCHQWDGEAYIGPIHRVRFTTKKPHDWDLRDNVLVLHHVPAGGFAYINSDA